VVDGGEGMNEQIIDHTVNLFSSSGERPHRSAVRRRLRRIFAIEPELVVLDTGQSGESWRILFARTAASAARATHRGTRSLHWRDRAGSPT
jgi:hypothetical protein